MSARVTFSRSNTVHHALKQAVDGYFLRTGKTRFADGRFFAKALALLLVQAGLGAAILFAGTHGVHGAWLLLMCAGLGFVIAQIGFNVGHDAIHGAVSPRKWINTLFGWTFDLAGASSVTWATSHNFVHHTYTNMVGLDHDLEPGPYMRFYERDDVFWLHRFQHVYAWFLYGLTTIVWVFKKDFVQALTPDLRSGRRPPRKVMAQVVACKLVHWAVFLALPLAVLPHAWWQVLLGYFVMHYFVGFTLAVVFQLAHCVEGPVFPEVDGAYDRPWAEHQLLTTANFATDSAWALALTGGLNHQVEHHLFSKISHVHYPALRPLVREVAAAHGLPYHEHPTFLGAVASHYRQMRAFGQPRSPVVDEPVATLPDRPALSVR